MPYSKRRDIDDCDGVAVVKDSTGEVMGCHDTENAADEQIAAIEANEDASFVVVPRLGQSADFISEDAAEAGMKVEWDSQGDRPARGVIDRVSMDDPIDVPDSDFTIDPPAALIEVYEPTEEGHVPTGDMAGHQLETLRQTDFEIADENEATAERMGLALRRPVVLSSDTEDTPDTEVAKLRRKDSATLQFSHGQGQSHQPTQEELEQINELSSVQLGADEVVVFEDLAASTEPMPNRPMRLTKSALQRLASRYRDGRQFVVQHDVTERVGSTFDASVSRETVGGTEADWLRVKSFAVVNEETTDERRQTIQDMKTGVLRHTSVSLDGGEWETVELETDAGERTLIEIRDNPDASGQRLEAEELSRVHLGAVENAQSTATA